MTESGGASTEIRPRYCASCGEIFSDLEQMCPACGVWWRPNQVWPTVPALTTALTEFRRLHDLGAIDAASYVVLREDFEGLLLRVRPARAGRRSGEVPLSEASPAAAPAAAPLLPQIAEWTAARQADILLYLGAFLLSIAALIFVGYQGHTFGGTVRFTILLAYTAAFLALGLRLPHWERVREAGIVFLALGAVLVPVNVIALRTQVLGGSVPLSWFWLAGSALTAALYLTLGLRGFGRLYLYPGALAVLFAWASLGAVVKLPPEWFGAWFAAAALLIVLSAGRLREDYQQPALLAAAGLGVFALLVAQTTALVTGRNAAQLPATYAELLAAAFVVYLRWRWREALAVIPVFAAGLGGSAGWAAGLAGVEWLGAWVALAAAGYLATAYLDDERRIVWRASAGAAAVVALCAAHAATAAPGTVRAQLPVTYAIVLAIAVWDAWRSYDPLVLAVLPVLAAVLVDALLWTVGVGREWWSYAGLAAVALVIVTTPRWRALVQPDGCGWLYALAGALVVPAVFSDGFTEVYRAHPVHGLAAFAVAALLIAWIAFGARGALARLLIPNPTDAERTAERQGVLFLARLWLIAAAAYFNAWAGLRGADRATVFAVLGVLIWAALVAAGRRWPETVFSAAPAAVLFLITAAGLTVVDSGRMALILTLGAAGPALTFTTIRRWSLWLLAAGFGAVAIGVAWHWRGFAEGNLPLAYASAAIVLWAALIPLRSDELWQPGERGAVVTALSWTPALLAIGSAWVVLLRRADRLAESAPLVQTREWAVLAIVVGVAGLLAVTEGARLRRRAAWIPGSGALLVAGLLAIAIARPGFVQAYTLPAGLYLIALGFSFRTSDELFGRQMAVHEGIMVAGILTLALPPARSGWESGGGAYGLELMAMGVVFLAIGLVLYARWLVAGGVLALGGVGLRWLLAYSAEAPRWLTLGIAGTALIGAGVLLLFQRERWERLRRRIGRWWLDENPEIGPRQPEPPAGQR